MLLPSKYQRKPAYVVDLTITLFRTVPFLRKRRGRVRRRITQSRRNPKIIADRPNQYGTMKDEKVAITFSQPAASIADVNVLTSARSARGPTHSQNVNSVLNLNAWDKALQHHPDPEFRTFILDGIIHGVNIGHNGVSHNIVSNNWPSATKYHTEVENVIKYDLARGRKIGPFNTPPDNFVGSPLGAFEKKRSRGKYRVIHDLSWPPGQSINENIDIDSSVHYVTIDDIVNRVTSYGIKGVKMASLDLEAAYKHIFVRIEDRHLLGLVWDTIDPDGNPHREYYMDMTLPFGLKSSAMLFNKYADGLQYVMRTTGATIIEHYLDDYFTCGAPNTMECETNLVIMSHVCKQLGFSLQPEKLVYPTTQLEYIGIVIDSVSMELRISSDRLNEILLELQIWKDKTCCSKRELLSLIGKLSFVARVVKSGRTFIRRLIDHAKGVPHLHYRIRLHTTALKDIEWWLTFLPSWNGISMFYDNQWISNADLHLWTDASDIAIGAYLDNEWFYEPFQDDALWIKSMPITCESSMP